MEQPIIGRIEQLTNSSPPASGGINNSYGDCSMQCPYSNIDSKIRKIVNEELNRRAREHLQATLSPECLQALQKQFPYLKLYEPGKPNPAHLQH